MTPTGRHGDNSLARSAALYERAQKVLIEGSSSASRGPASFGGIPPYMTEGQGARLRDADGNEYIDWMLCFGALPLGHAHPVVVDAVRREVARGAHFATATDIEVDLAELLTLILPHVEKIRFTNSGTESIMLAVRLARGVTGRSKILKFEGHYHGWYDSVLLNSNPQLPTALGHPADPIRLPDSSGLTMGSWEDTLVIPWNDLDALERAMGAHGREIACVLTEGVMANMGVIPPEQGYLSRVQSLCRHHGALFCLDETVTGFRLAASGAAEAYELDPDLVTYGKALGQGFPIAAVGGKAPIMDGLAWGKIMHYGSHNASRIGLVAARAGLQVLLADNRAAFARLQQIGEKMAAAIRAAIAASRHAAIVQNAGSIFQLYFTDKEKIGDFRDYCAHVDSRKFQRFATLLRAEGIFVNPSNTLHWLSCTAHTDGDIAATAGAVAAALDRLEN